MNEGRTDGPGMVSIEPGRKEGRKEGRNRKGEGRWEGRKSYYYLHTDGGEKM